MAGKGDALIVVGADATAVKKAAAEAVSAWKDVGRSLSTEMGNATQSIINDLGRVVTAQGHVNFSQQHQQVREFEAATARMAVSTGRNLDTVRSAAETTGIEIGRRPAEVNAWAQEVGRLTGNFQGAEKSIRGFAGLAAATNRSADDYRGLAVELQNVGHVAGDSTHTLGVMTAQAAMLGTVGGPAAFADQVLGLQDVISHFAVKGEADFLKVTAAAAVLGKGLNQAAAQRVEQRALGFLTSNTWQHERYLGHKITDEHGQVKDPVGTLIELRDKVVKQYGSQRSRSMLSSMFGGDMETASAVMNLKASDVAATANVKPSKANEDALHKYLGTDAGQRDVAQSELAKASRDLLGSSTALGRAADAMQKFAGSHPIASAAASTAAAGITGAVAGAAGKSVTFAIRKGIAAAVPSVAKGALAAGGATVAGIGLLVGSGVAAGYGIHKFDQAEQEREKLDAHARDVAAQSGVEQRLIAVRHANAAARGLEGLTPEQRGAAINATSSAVQHAKDSMSALQLSHGGGNALAALIAELRKQGKSEVDSDKLARAIVAALQGAPLKVDVSAAPDTPVTATQRTAHSSSAGHQGHH